MFGKHCLKHWSSTQSSVTLSSGEAEFHGLVKGAAVALGQQALFEDLGLTVMELNRRRQELEARETSLVQ